METSLFHSSIIIYRTAVRICYIIIYKVLVKYIIYLHYVFKKDHQSDTYLYCSLRIFIRTQYDP